ncbi:unnamed protein product [Amoebophrya sp. A120]|nr:unnamed protein product [Amoebophrya sp. A120]|eukprot:GSA120T00024122001.1
MQGYGYGYEEDWDYDAPPMARGREKKKKKKHRKYDDDENYGGEGEAPAPPAEEGDQAVAEGQLEEDKAEEQEQGAAYSTSYNFDFSSSSYAEAAASTFNAPMQEGEGEAAETEVAKGDELELAAQDGNEENGDGARPDEDGEVTDGVITPRFEGSAVAEELEARIEQLENGMPAAQAPPPTVLETTTTVEGSSQKVYWASCYGLCPGAVDNYVPCSAWSGDCCGFDYETRQAGGWRYNVVTEQYYKRDPGLFLDCLLGCAITCPCLLIFQTGKKPYADPQDQPTCCQDFKALWKVMFCGAEQILGHGMVGLTLTLMRFLFFFVIFSLATVIVAEWSYTVECEGKVGYSGVPPIYSNTVDCSDKDTATLLRGLFEAFDGVFAVVLAAVFCYWKFMLPTEVRNMQKSEWQTCCTDFLIVASQAFCCHLAMVKRSVCKAVDLTNGAAPEQSPVMRPMDIPQMGSQPAYRIYQYDGSSGAAYRQLVGQPVAADFVVAKKSGNQGRAEGEAVEMQIVSGQTYIAPLGTSEYLKGPGAETKSDQGKVYWMCCLNAFNLWSGDCCGFDYDPETNASVEQYCDAGSCVMDGFCALPICCPCVLVFQTGKKPYQNYNATMEDDSFQADVKDTMELVVYGNGTIVADYTVSLIRLMALLVVTWFVSLLFLIFYLATDDCSSELDYGPPYSRFTETCPTTFAGTTRKEWGELFNTVAFLGYVLSGVIAVVFCYWKFMLPNEVPNLQKSDWQTCSMDYCCVSNIGFCFPCHLPMVKRTVYKAVDRLENPMAGGLAVVGSAVRASRKMKSGSRKSSGNRASGNVARKSSRGSSSRRGRQEFV